MNDGEAATLRADDFEMLDLNAQPVAKVVERVAFDLPSIERGGYAHFMLKEIFEQPETIRNAFRGRIVRSEGTAKLGGVDEALLRRAKRCHILACGTSYHAGLIGKYMLENLARVPTQVSGAAEFRYANPVIEPDTLMIAISQSGETADTLAGVREAKLHGAETIGICNVVGSSIARECGQGVYIHAGPEIGVASTKAFTGQLTVLALLAVHMGRMRGMSLQTALEYVDAIERLPEQAEAALAANDDILSIAEEYAEAPNFLYIGRLYEYPLALEGALKLKEISYLHAEGIPAAELKHGPIALGGRPHADRRLLRAERHAGQDDEQHHGDPRARRPHHRRGARGRRGAAEGGRAHHHRAGHARPAGAHRRRAAAATAGLPHRRAARLRRGPPAQPGQERDRRVKERL